MVPSTWRTSTASWLSGSVMVSTTSGNARANALLVRMFSANARRLLHPVDRRLGQIGDADALDGNLLLGERGLGVGGPTVGGGDDDAVDEPDAVPGTARGGEEGVDVALLQGVLGVEELALDGRPLAGCGGTRHQVDA